LTARARYFVEQFFLFCSNIALVFLGLRRL
jgi:hypothetical protein